jgi:hypothetical protein
VAFNATLIVSERSAAIVTRAVPSVTVLVLRLLLRAVTAVTWLPFTVSTIVSFSVTVQPVGPAQVTGTCAVVPVTLTCPRVALAVGPVAGPVVVPVTGLVVVLAAWLVVVVVVAELVVVVAGAWPVVVVPAPALVVVVVVAPWTVTVTADEEDPLDVPSPA